MMQAAEEKLHGASLIFGGRAVADRGNRQENGARTALLLPAILILLAFSIFPLIVSVYLSMSRLRLVRGGFEITFIGLRNYEKALFGSDQRLFLGKFGELTILGWILLLSLAGVLIYFLLRYITSGRMRLIGLFFRLVTVFLTMFFAWLVISTLSGDGLPGTLAVTLLYVLVGVSLQYSIGLGLALLLTQNLPGKRFFRIVFLLPMMITPVGIGFLFRMMTDTLLGPLSPIWTAIGLKDLSWVENPHAARLAIVIGDVWQWTPFMFIILLAALEGVSREIVEAALVDGANRGQLFRRIILPEIVPVSTTLILIRMIETFKILDLPMVLTRGGPGTATESVTMQAYKLWRAQDLGGSAALAYMLLFVVTFFALVFVNHIRRRLLEAV